MRFLLLSALTVVAALPASARPDAQPTFSSRYTKLTQCKDVDLAPSGEDWVYIRCKGLGSIPIWYVCTDSARCRYGFGVKPNVSRRFFGTGRGGSWPIEWRGVQRNGHFNPTAIVVRLPSADADPTPRGSLIVYRLRGDGTSCIVGDASSNSDARKIADNSARGFRCVSEPDIL